jgi:hypothetical protein
VDSPIRGATGTIKAVFSDERLERFLVALDSSSITMEFSRDELEESE